MFLSFENTFKHQVSLLYKFYKYKLHHVATLFGCITYLSNYITYNLHVLNKRNNKRH